MDVMDKLVFKSILEICEKHEQRLSSAISHLRPFFPFSAQAIISFSDVELAFCDQFLLRYSKLQDYMGEKLLTAVLELTYEQGELSAFIDKLNRLEKIGALPSVNEWLKLREMRNQLAHEYPDDPNIQASILNKAFDSADRIIEILSHVKIYSERFFED